MAEPNGKLVTPTGFNPSGVLRALELDVNDYLKVAVMNLVTPAGVAFPATPAAGDLFFRTDLGLLCYFDGTRWLTVGEFAESLPLLNAAIDSYSSPGLTRSDKALWFTRISVTTQVAVTNTATKYWTVTVRSLSSNFGAATDIYSIDTHLDAASVYVSHEGNASTPNPANYGGINVHAVPTSTPGALTVLLTVFHRLIVT